MGSRLELFPLAETVRWRGKLLPRYGWYMLSGAVCDIGQFILYKTLWSSFGLPTFSWTAAYVLSIALRQEAHKVFVFGHYEGSWWRSLWRFYCVYFLTVATSMPVNWALVHLMSCLPTQLLTLGIAESTYAYFGTTIYTGIFSYLRLKANWRRPSSSLKLCKSGVDMTLLPTDRSNTVRLKPSAFSKYQVSASELSRRGLYPHANPCLDGRGGSRPKHTRTPSCGSEYSKLLAI